MRLGTGIFSSRIARGSINRSKLAVAGQAALQLVTDLVGAGLFERISTPGCEEE